MKRVLLRSRKYYKLGVALISLPITFLGFSRNLYAFMDNIPYGLGLLVFPTFQRFVWLGGLMLLPTSIIIGWLWLKSPFYHEEIRLGAEKNPYSQDILKAELNMLHGLSLMAGEMGLEEAENSLREAYRIKEDWKI